MVGNKIVKDFVGKLIDELLIFFKKNYRKPRLWIGLLIIAFCIVLLFPYIDSNFFCFSRIEKRIGILEEVISKEEIQIAKDRRKDFIERVMKDENI